VTTSTGLELDAGEWIDIPISNTSKIWLIADAASQAVSYFAI